MQVGIASSVTPWKFRRCRRSQTPSPLTTAPLAAGLRHVKIQYFNYLTRCQFSLILHLKTSPPFRITTVHFQYVFVKYYCSPPQSSPRHRHPFDWSDSGAVSPDPWPWPRMSNVSVVSLLISRFLIKSTSTDLHTLNTLSFREHVLIRPTKRWPSRNPQIVQFFLGD